MTTVRLLRRWLAPSAVAVAALAVAACGKPGTGTKSTTSTAAPANIGASLYPPAAAPAVATQLAGPEPIIASQGLVQFDETITLSAEVDGKLELVATPVEFAVKHGMPSATQADRLIGHPRKPDWKHVRVVDGDVVKQGQVVASLDNSQAVLDMDALVESADAAKKALTQSEASLVEYAAVVEKTEKLSSSSDLERIKYRIEYVSAKVQNARLFQEYVKLNGDTAKAVDRKQRHDIVSPFDGKVVRVLRARGVVVKAGEPILEVQNTGRFRIEAKVSQELANELENKLPLPVSVEPVRVLRPEPYTASHRQEVTGLAVFTTTANGKSRPVVVSASADGTAKVWDATGDTKTQHTLAHPNGSGGVRSVAAVARGDGRLVATGDGNGKVRLWDVSDLTQPPTKPAHEFEDGHGQGVGAIAFSADGQFMATAAGRDVFVWDVGGKKKKYALPADHRDDVKAVHFTPQCTLVTVCRDKAIRVWSLGSDGASLLRTLDHRSGAVDVLGVSADGGRVLFDQNAGRIDLVNLADSNNTGNLLNTGSGQRFSGLALFSPDSKLVLTGAGDADAKGELQVWSAPDTGRGSELKRLATPDRTAVSCAAFSPDPAHRFVAVGTHTGSVHFWVLPPADQMALPGKLVSITRPDQATAVLRVEVENAGGKYDSQLQDRGTARLVIDRNAKTLPAGPMPVVPVPPQPKAVAPVVNPLAGK